MHYYPDDQSKEGLDKVRRNSVCIECGRQLSAYLGNDKRVYLACSGQVHEGITREYKPPVDDYQSKVRREIEMEQKLGHEASRELATIPKQGQLTQPQAMTILKLQYPEATENEIVKTAIFCRDFGLHPLANEVYLIPFKGKNVMVVGISASRKIAHARKGQFSFLDDTPRAATEEEIVKQYGKDSDEAKDNIISITKLKGEGGNLAIGFGLWPKKDNPYGMDKGNTKRNMTNIRSERQGMDRLPGKPMPRYEVVDEQYIETPSGLVDTATGEITEPEVVVGEVVEVKGEVVKDNIPLPTAEAKGKELHVEQPLDETVVTPKDVEDLKALMKKVDKTAMDVGTIMARELGWTVPKTFQDLKKGQITVLMGKLKELVGE